VSEALSAFDWHIPHASPVRVPETTSVAQVVSVLVRSHAQYKRAITPSFEFGELVTSDKHLVTSALAALSEPSNPIFDQVSPLPGCEPKSNQSVLRRHFTFQFSVK